MNRAYANDPQRLPGLQMQRCSLSVLDLVTIEGPMSRMDMNRQLDESEADILQSIKNLANLRYIRGRQDSLDARRTVYFATGKRPAGAPVAIDPRSPEAIEWAAAQEAAAEAQEPSRLAPVVEAPGAAPPPALPAAATSSRAVAQQFWFSPVTAAPRRRSGSMDFARVPSRTGFVQTGTA